MTLEEMRAVDVRTVDIDTLVDIRDVHVDRSLPEKERMMDFIRQVKNPYVFRCGNVVIKSVFADTDVTLEDCMESYIRHKARCL